VLEWFFRESKHDRLKTATQADGERPSACSPKSLFRKSLMLNSVLKFVPLLRLATESERPRLAAADHSENWYDLSRLQNGPVKGMGSRHSGNGPTIRWLSEACRETHQ
jgi:hypothetical protein